MRRLFPLTALIGGLYLAGLLPGAIGHDKVADKGFRGTWTGTLQTRLDKDMEISAKAVFGAEDVTMEIGDKEKVVVKGTYKLWNEKNPKAIDLMLSKPDGEGKKLLAIYFVEGDVLKICWDSGDFGRPESFDIKGDKFKGDDPRLLTLKRQK